MSYSFEKWKKQRGKSGGHVRFGKSQMFISTTLLKQVTPDLNRFDLLVDKAKRVFALRFGIVGAYKWNTCPAQIGVAAFMAEYKPVLETRIPMRRITEQAGDAMWVGSLDDGEI
jgi:hypothetical protein